MDDVIKEWKSKLKPQYIGYKQLQLGITECTYEGDETL